MCCYNILGFFTESSSLTNSDGIGSNTAIKTDSGNPVTQSEEDIEGQGDKNGMGEDELKARTGAYRERDEEDDGNVDETDKTTQRKEHGDGAREDCLNGNDTGGEGEMEGGGETIRNREGEGGHNGKRTESTNTGGDSLCAQTNQHSQLSSSTDSTATVPKKVLHLHFQLLKYLSIFHRIH